MVRPCWGQALPQGKDIFIPFALMALPKIRPNPELVFLPIALKTIPGAKPDLITASFIPNYKAKITEKRILVVTKKRQMYNS